jgi:hypothetical protein
MGLEIIGAGFGRTGTMTLKLALETLGYQPCYHMIEIIQSPSNTAEAWLKAISGHPANWEEIFRGFRAAVDWPVIYFLPELIERYPEAKVILTERDANSWYQSAKNTIFKAIRYAQNDGAPLHQKLSNEIIIKNTFNNKVDDEACAIDVYNRHVAWVKNNVSDDRLICFNVADGWEGLCPALNQPLPEEPFPHSNTTSEFRGRFFPSWATMATPN